MKGYGQFCPIAVACETFAERWTPLILREVLAGAQRFNDIRPRPVPPDVERAPAHRLRAAADRKVVVRFDFRAFPACCRGFKTCWLLLERHGADVCMKDAGFDVDLVVVADAGAMARSRSRRSVEVARHLAATIADP